LSVTRISAIAVVVGLVTTGCAILDPNEQARQAEMARQEAERQRLAEESWKRKQRDEEARRIAEERARPRVAPALANALKVGRYRCELKRQVNILTKLPDNRGVTLRWKQKNYKMLAVQSNTGAVRLENEASGLVWITIVGKSMLFDSKRGRQLANECRL
jgi:hypothetical protein